MNMPFQKVLKAAREREARLWQLADALLSESDNMCNGPRGFKAIAEALLAEHTIEHDPNWLRKLRKTSEAFPPDRRHPQLGIELHILARNPDLLDTLVGYSRKHGKPVTKDLITDVLRGIRLTRKWERRNGGQD
jgi:hypothetical protein